ncbi:hypothetical protein Hanom_Chr06g00516841 [Helianthus anomalus]
MIKRNSKHSQIRTLPSNGFEKEKLRSKKFLLLTYDFSEVISHKLKGIPNTPEVWNQIDKVRIEFDSVMEWGGVASVEL